MRGGFNRGIGDPRDISVKGHRQPLIFVGPRRVPLRDPEENESERVEIYSPGASGSWAFPLPPVTTASRLRRHYRGAFIDPLYIYLLCHGPLYPTVEETTYVLADSPQAIFDQYYKNQPTDFHSEIWSLERSLNILSLSKAASIFLQDIPPIRFQRSISVSLFPQLRFSDHLQSVTDLHLSNVKTIFTHVNGIFSFWK